MKVAVVGAGAWGTTLSIIFTEAGHDVSLWIYERELCDKMKEERENKWYLPGFQVPASIGLSCNLSDAVSGAELIVFSTPSKHLREIATQARKFVPLSASILSAVKGLEEGTGERMSEVLRSVYPDNKIAVISGPNLSKEISKGLPAATIVASIDLNVAKKIQSAVKLERFRIYVCNDVIGVELGGTLKNIIAIAAGIADGLSLGDNAKSALMVRGMVEISRLGVAMGASAETFAGLSGMGDLITTCSSKLSRNHCVGEAIAKGEKLEDILSGTKEVAEGVLTAKVAAGIAKKLNVEMPITAEVCKVLFERKDPYKAIASLMMRELKKE